MRRSYREHVIDAQPDNRVGVWHQGQKVASIRYADNQHWRADLILHKTGAPSREHQENNLVGTGFRRNEFKQLREAVDAVIDQQPTDGRDEAAQQIQAFFDAE